MSKNIRDFRENIEEFQEMLDELGDPAVMKDQQSRTDNLPLNQMLKNVKNISSQEQMYNDKIKNDPYVVNGKYTVLQQDAWLEFSQD